MTVEAAQIPAYRTFAVQVARLRRLSPSFLRVTFTGPDLDDFAPNGSDQRIKVLLPLPGRGMADCPTGPDWYGEWRALPAERQIPIRTYTVRAVRPRAARGRRRLRPARRDRPGVGLGGAGRRRRRGRAGRPERPLPRPDRRLRVAPARPTPPACSSPVTRPRCRRSARSSSPCRPAGAARVLLEVPTADDVLHAGGPGRRRGHLAAPPVDGHDGPRARGSLLTAAVVAAVRELADDLAPPRGADLDDVDIDTGILWEVPEDRRPRAVRPLRLAGRGGRRGQGPAPPPGAGGGPRPPVGGLHGLLAPGPRERLTEDSRGTGISGPTWPSWPCSAGASPNRRWSIHARR